MTQATDIVRQALELAQKHTHISALDYQVYADALDKLSELERVEKGVSLRECAEAIAVAAGHESEIDDPCHMANYRATAKAVLDKAKVKYHD